MQNFNGSRLRTEEEIAKLKQEKSNLEEALRKSESANKNLTMANLTLEKEKKDLRITISSLDKENQQLEITLKKEKDDNLKVFISYNFVLKTYNDIFIISQVLEELRKDLDSQQDKIDSYHRENLQLNIELKKNREESANERKQLESQSMSRISIVETKSKQLEEITKV